MRFFHYNDEEKQLHRYLEERGHTNTVVLADADPFAATRHERFDAAFVGLHPHGLRLIKTLHQGSPDCFVTIIASDQNTRMAVEAMKRGAFDYLHTPLDFAEVERTAIMMGREHQMLKQRRNLETQLADTVGEDRFVGSSHAVRNLRRLIEKAAASSAPVLITGETGTGKELVARLLHDRSPRHDRPLVSINCNAIPDTLLESELFGYRKGAFTSADADRQGLLAAANSGTFFFDEISDLPQPLQGKILRVLQEGEVLPLGDTKPQSLNLRFISATNRDLGQRVREGRFREDLYYRLNVVLIHVAPLRERMEDVAPLVRHFLEHYAGREGRTPLKVSPAVWRWLGNYHWPGNVRELENLCQRAVALTEGDTLDVDLLALSDSFTAPASAEPSSSPSPAESALSARRDRIERQMIEQTLAEHSGNVTRAAKSLSISRTTLYAKVKRMGIDLRRGWRAE